MVHTFSALGRNLAVDVNSGAVHVLDKLCCDLLSLVEGPMGDACPQDLKDRLSQYDARELDEAWTELLELQQLRPGLVQFPGVVLREAVLQILGTGISHGALHQRKQVTAQLVQHMDRPAVHIHRQVPAQRGKCVYHNDIPPNLQRLAADFSREKRAG